MGSIARAELSSNVVVQDAVARTCEWRRDVRVDETSQRILDFLDQQLFRPILRDNTDDHPPFERAEVEAVRGSMAREYDGIRSAASANAMLHGYREAARRSAENGLEARLRGLGLPTFAGVRDELEKLAAELGVPGEPEPTSGPS